KDQPTLLDIMLSRSVTSKLDGDIGKTVAVDFLDAKDHKVSLSLDRAKLRGKVTVIGNLPPVHFWVDAHKVGGNIGYVKFNLFVDPEAVASAFQNILKTCQDCKGFVVDVRGNPGGLGGLATGVAGFFVDKQQRLGQMFLRGGPMNFPIFPRATPFL